MKQDYEHVWLCLKSASFGFFLPPFCSRVSQEEEVGSCKRISCPGQERCHLKYLPSGITILLVQMKEQQNGAFCISARKDWVFPSCGCEIKPAAARKGKMLMSTLTASAVCHWDWLCRAGLYHSATALAQPGNPPLPCQPLSLKPSCVSSGSVLQLWLHPQWKEKGLCLQMQ